MRPAVVGKNVLTPKVTLTLGAQWGNTSSLRRLGIKYSGLAQWKSGVRTDGGIQRVRRSKTRLVNDPNRSERINKINQMQKTIDGEGKGKKARKHGLMVWATVSPTRVKD